MKPFSMNLRICRPSLTQQKRNFNPIPKYTFSRHLKVQTKAKETSKKGKQA